MDAIIEFLPYLGSLLVGMVVVFGALWLVLGAMARPKGKDIEVFTSSAPGEKILAWKVVNACLSNAEPSAFADFLFAQMKVAKTASMTLGLIRKMTGGLWVGGRAVLTTHRIIFAPNAINRAMHTDLSMITLPLAGVTGLNTRFGVGTSIIDVSTPAGSLTIRCYGAGKFCEAIATAQSQLVPAARAAGA